MQPAWIALEVVEHVQESSLVDAKYPFTVAFELDNLRRHVRYLFFVVGNRCFDLITDSSRIRPLNFIPSNDCLRVMNHRNPSIRSLARASENPGVGIL
jgi:hypothetical protein